MITVCYLSYLSLCGLQNYLPTWHLVARLSRAGDSIMQSNSELAPKGKLREIREAQNDLHIGYPQSGSIFNWASPVIGSTPPDVIITLHCHSNMTRHAYITLSLTRDTYHPPPDVNI